jgi:predicted SAM-dependent methyltransferase
MRKLHIGGQVRAPGWEVLDAIEHPAADHVGLASDLSRFGDSTFEALYASHVVEHLDYHKELIAGLKEWNRVLVPGGTLYVSAPDLDTLAELFLLRESLSADDRFMVMRMMFGGHATPFDYHLVGLNEEFLHDFLVVAGFVDIKRVEDFGLFQDTSTMRFHGWPISVNLTARRGPD